MPIIPTVKVKKDIPQGYMLINEADFDAEVHEVWTGQEVPGGSVEKPGFALEDVVTEPALANLRAAGFASALRVVEADLAQIKAVQGVGDRLAEKLKAAAAPFVEVIEER